MSNFQKNSAAARALAAALLAMPIASMAAGPAADPDAEAFRQLLAKKYPNTRFGAINRTPVAGVREVWMGTNVAYVGEDGRYFIFGHLYDMQAQTDLTATKKKTPDGDREHIAMRYSFVDLPLHDAIKTVRGSGERSLAVFSDPLCPYCRDLEEQLSKLDNVTIYTFLFPIASLHPDAMAISDAIWCAADRPAAWHRYMASGEAPKSTPCASPVLRNIRLANKAGIHGTPFILFARGGTAAGLLDAATLERRLAGK